MYIFWKMFERYLLLHELHSGRRYYENMYTHALKSGDDISMRIYKERIESVSKDLEDLYYERGT